MILARYRPGAFRHDGAFEQEFIFAAPAAIQIRRRSCALSMSQLTRSPSFGPAAAPIRRRRADHRERMPDRRKLIAGIKCSTDWRDIGALKRGLIEIWIAERNAFAERVVKDMKARK